MKKRERVIFIILLLLCLFFPIHKLSADSGWDGGYDSGGSSDWGSSSSDWGSSSSDWDSSDWSSSGGSYSSGSLDPFMVMAIIAFIVIIFAITNKPNSGSNRLMVPGTSLGKLNPYDIDKLKKLLPDFDEEKFKEKTYELYKEIQVAWMNFDNDSIRKCVTDELYNTYSAQLATLKVKNQKNIMKDFQLLDSKIIGMETKEKLVSLTIKMKIECYDYIVDKEEKTLRGNDKQKVIYEYAMTFNKGVSDKPNKCPNCNAPLDNVNSSKCPYCDSNIINESYDWVLAKKQVLSQTINHKK
ncbi:MAG: Tim44-like domain-containing protein [Bacilli bacterium]|nr:Tim44-like domain-containing protein [Bacilli bacterium]